MIFAQVPTPIPDGQLLQAVAKTVDNAFQQGLVGVLLLFSAALFILAIAIAIVAWSRRNIKPSDSTAGTNAAINALAEAISAGNKRFDDVLENQKVKDTADREQDKEKNESWIESISAQADATNNLADALKKLGVDNTSMKDDLHTMTVTGSKPLNDLITKFDSLQSDVQAIRANNDTDHAAIDTILHDIADMKAIVIRLEQRRATSETSKVNIPNPLPIEIINPATG